jgi:hypothetical protein
MRIDLYTKCVLTALVILLAVIAFRNPMPVRAALDPSNLWIEPGYTSLRAPNGEMQVQGKMVVNLATGDIFGFPTGTGGPYPVDPTSSTPPVSSAIYLGKFDFASMRK